MTNLGFFKGAALGVLLFLLLAAGSSFFPRNLEVQNPAGNENTVTSTTQTTQTNLGTTSSLVSPSSVGLFSGQATSSGKSTTISQPTASSETNASTTAAGEAGRSSGTILSLSPLLVAVVLAVVAYSALRREVMAP